ncbi:T-cell surface glycoprotein CD3 delta chain-like isoform X3 [Hemiscyllium ocellatum]|uniref:T-cell surface glycoprotein CD3 delta chain-like isoform X3 n=1 Tax=Hemiscyllium ocellatum TaxID=170820 RepID=UPI0029670CA1|nr:T-cell surface glycoprotein CD3 delta chain-like isoform X3 [Hemiscyllium ocellatum]
MKCPILLITATFVALQLFGPVKAEIKVRILNTHIEINCSSKSIQRADNGKEWKNITSPAWNVSKLEDSHSRYRCGEDTDSWVHVFIKNCLNCVKADTGTVLGLALGNLIATILIAVAVYCVSAPRKVKLHRASDRQALVPSDETGIVYSGIEQSSRQEYSRLEFKNKK